MRKTFTLKCEEEIDLVGIMDEFGFDGGDSAEDYEDPRHSDFTCGLFFSWRPMRKLLNREGDEWTRDRVLDLVEDEPLVSSTAAGLGGLLAKVEAVIEYLVERRMFSMAWEFALMHLLCFKLDLHTIALWKEAADYQLDLQNLMLFVMARSDELRVLAVPRAPWFQQ